MKIEELYLLAEGGAVGHLMHLYDNPDLTFGEIKKILSSAASGKLQKVTEKFDGLNLVFTWDASASQLKVARAAGDIKRGGMDADALSAKFAGRGNLKTAFDSAFQVLNGAISAIPAKKIIEVFGESGNRWYSIEVIYTENANVINYDSNAIVFHEWPIFELDDTGRVQPADDRSGSEILSSYVDKMQTAISNRGWRVMGPAVVRLGKISNKSILTETFAKIDEAVSAAGLSDSATVDQYLATMLRFDVEDLGIQNKVQRMVIDRIMGVPDAPTLVDIKKIVDNQTYKTIQAFVKASPALFKRYIQPIELAINDFAVELLKGFQSTLVDDSTIEIQRLKDEVAAAASNIESSGDESAMQVLKSQMEKLKSLENIAASAEGVVFIWKGQAYKFTGSFASINSILGLFRYGKPKTK